MIVQEVPAFRDFGFQTVVVVVVVVSHYYTSDEGAMLVHLITLHGQSPPRASSLRSLELTWNVLLRGSACFFQACMKRTHSIATPGSL